MGRSGSGKSTIADRLSKFRGYDQIVSYATREPRINDPMDVYSHLFVDDEFYNNYNKKNILAFYDNGTTKYWVGKENFKKESINLYVVDIKGMMELKEKLPEADILPIYIDVERSQTEARMFKRGDTLKSIEQRLVSDDLNLSIENIDESCIVVDGNWKILNVCYEVKRVISKHFEDMSMKYDHQKEGEIRSNKCQNSCGEDCFDWCPHYEDNFIRYGVDLADQKDKSGLVEIKKTEV
jgi:guanylate kinase